MAINVVLSVLKNDRRATSKNIGATTGFSGTLRDGSSVVDPVIRIEADNLSDFSYAYIPVFNRWYFINNIVSVRNKIWDVYMHCDVLSTYWSSVAKCDCMISRGSKRIYDLKDSQIIATPDKKISITESSLEPFSGHMGYNWCVYVSGAISGS